jgi:hypothetical protein
MSPRIIHIPLSGGDRKAQAKGIRYAHGIHESAYRESVLIRNTTASGKARSVSPMYNRHFVASLTPFPSRSWELNVFKVRAIYLVSTANYSR